MLLGFETRVRPEPIARARDAERIATYLLREDVDAVVTADRHAWPPAHPDPCPADVRRGLYPDPEAATENWRRWGGPAWLLAITVAAPDDEAAVERYGSWSTPQRPLDPAWRRLGFDICEGISWEFLSALSDCGYLPEERPAAQERFARHLNALHLFEDLDQARRFRAYSDARVPEHAPLVVHGLFLAGALEGAPPPGPRPAHTFRGGVFSRCAWSPPRADRG